MGVSKGVQNQHEDDSKSSCSDSEKRSDAGSIEHGEDRPSDTVIIFDWDDTLLCTSAINSQKWEPQQLEQLESIVKTILHTAMLMGETLIVTNGIESWVQRSASRYLPGLLPTLSRLMVVSARSKYEHAHPGDPIMWKCETFKEILANRHGGLHCNASSVNLVVLGDSDPEIEAAQRATKVLSSDSLVKIVKFQASPSVTELLGQLRRVERELGQIVEEDHNVNIGLVQHQFLAHLEHLATWVRGWTFSGKTFSCIPQSLAFPTIWPLLA